MNKKALITATVQSHIAQFHRPLINMLKKNGYEVHIAAKNNLAEKNGLRIENADVIYDIPFSRSPKSLDNVKAYKQIKRIISENDYEVIHCNTPVGGIVTRFAARKARKRGCKVYYTAHGFHFYKGAPLLNWIIYYPLERFFARFSDKVITINREDFKRAQQFKTKAYHIHGVGADEKRYNTEAPDENMRNKSGFKETDFLVLCTGELNKNKNQITLIKAIAKTENKNIKAILAGNGQSEAELRNAAKELGIEERVALVGYRTDLERFVKMSDVVCSMSIREGLGLNIIEAVLCGKAVVVANNRGHRDLIEDGIGGYMIDALDCDMLAKKLDEMCVDGQTVKRMSEHNKNMAQAFTMKNVVKEMELIYEL